MDKTLYTIIVHSENFAGLLNQVTAVFTRRQINIESLNVSASSIKGVHKYTITAWTDKDTIEKVTKQITKKIDVLQAHYFTDDEIYQHEIALYKITTPILEEKPEVSKVIRKYNARIVEVNAVFAIVEKNGMGEEITNLYDELRALDCVLQFVRSGRVAITTSCFERVNEYLADRDFFQVLTQFRDIHVHTTGIEIVIVNPDCFQSEVTLQNLIGMCAKQSEQFRLFGSQLSLFAF